MMLAPLLAGATGCSMTSPDGAADPVESPAAEAFLDSVQQRTFAWFWETTNPANGLVPDRWPTPSFSSVAAVGFGLTAYPVGVERGWVTREAARERTLTTLRFLYRAPSSADPRNVTGYRGFFYHFLDMQTGERFQDVELSTIDTALLMAGVLACQVYFDDQHPDEVAIRAYADSLYRRIEWPFFQTEPPAITMAWKPESGYNPSKWTGYDESMILMILALGSPTHPVGEDVWPNYQRRFLWGEFYGQDHVNFAPLFGHQYSHVWIDFRGIRDAYMRGRGIDYFENSRRATLAQRAYAIANPAGWSDYGAEVWGLTASDGPTDATVTIDGRERTFHSYWARGAGLDGVRDDGTIAPTAVGGSVPFAPEVAIAALQAMRRRYGEHLFRQYGFIDAFNPTFRQSGVSLKHGEIVPGVGWFDSDYLGIDQGPILLMIENYRSGLIWDLMKRSPHAVRGLCRAGFSGGWLAGRCGP